MEAAPPADLAQQIGLGHLRALCLAADATLPPRPRCVRSRRDAVSDQSVQTRQQRDQSSEFYVYLLVSRHACVFKLGHTRRLPERVQALRGQHGDFVEEDSYLVKVPSKRLARWIEAELKVDFNQPEWRAKAPRPYPERPYNDVGGLKEWYHLHVFTSMQATLLSLLQRDFDPRHPEYDPSAPFVPPCGVSLTEALRQAAASLRPVQPPPDPEERARLHAAEEGAAWLEYSEENFRHVRTWVQCRWPWEVSLSPVTAGPGGTRRRTLCFSLLSKCWYPPEECTNPFLTDPPMHWRDLYACAHLRLRSRGGEYLERRYFEPTSASSSGGTLAVTFVLDDLFDRNPAGFAPATDLPRRIRRWLVELGNSA